MSLPLFSGDFFCNMHWLLEGAAWPCSSPLSFIPQALVRKSCELGLIPWMRAFQEIREVIQLSIALPLLPENLMVLGYKIVVAFARRQGLLVLRRVRPFLLYLATYWIKRRWMRRRLCVYGSKQRTNNASESMNRCLRDTVGVHPGVYKFIGECWTWQDIKVISFSHVFLFLKLVYFALSGGLVKLEHRHNLFWRVLKQGRSPTRARKRTSILNDQRIRELTEDLQNPPGPLNETVYRFLRAASHVLENMLDEAMDDN